MNLVDKEGMTPIPAGGLEVPSLEKGLETLNKLVERQGDFGTKEHFLGEQGGKYRVFAIKGNMGGQYPKGYIPVAHTHPGGAMLTYEDLATTTAEGKSVGGVKTHLVAMGKGRFTVIEVPQSGPATATSLDVTTGKVLSVVELAPQGPKQTSPVPYVEGTGRAVDVQTPVKGYGKLAGAVSGSTPLGRIFGVPPVTPAAAPKVSNAAPASETTQSTTKQTPKVEIKTGTEPSVKAPFAPGTPGVKTMDPKPSGWAVLFIIAWEFALKDYVKAFFTPPTKRNPPQFKPYTTQDEFTKLHRPPDR